MTWAAVAGAGISLIGGMFSKKGGQQSTAQAQGISQADKDWMAAQVDKQTAANRVNQSNDYGASTWSQDPKTGQWSQSTTMNPAEQARLQDFRQMAANRMAAANSMDLSKPMDWSHGNVSSGPNAPGGVVATPRQGHYGPNGYVPAPGMAGPSGGGAQMAQPAMPQAPSGMGSPTGWGGGAAPVNAPIAPPSTPAAPAATPTAPPPTPAASGGSGLSPEDQAMIAQLRQQQQNGNISGNGSG
jgi:hypothetical protein